MQRIEIRNINSSKPTKPRMFDALIDDEGKIPPFGVLSYRSNRLSLGNVETSFPATLAYSPVSLYKQRES